MRPADRRAIKEETMSINSDWVYNKACSLMCNILVISYFYKEIETHIQICLRRLEQV